MTPSPELIKAVDSAYKKMQLDMFEILSEHMIERDAAYIMGQLDTVIQGGVGAIFENFVEQSMIELGIGDHAETHVDKKPH
jgi:hypothetical protein